MLPYVHMMAPALLEARDAMRNGQPRLAVERAAWLDGFTCALINSGVDTCAQEYQNKALAILDSLATAREE